MDEWLGGFARDFNQLKATIHTTHGVDEVVDLGALHSRGAPTCAAKARARAFHTSFADWNLTCTSRYIEPSRYTGQTGNSHQVYSFKHGRLEYLVPALVLFRGLFPMVKKGVGAAFTSRPLELLCTPVERNGHWSVVLPEFRGVFDARHRRPTLESLTWASLFPCGHRAWTSVYEHATRGTMGMDLPSSRVNLLPYGTREGKLVLVTKLTVNSLLSLGKPFNFASGASNSFIYNRNAEPLGPNPHEYYEQCDITDQFNHLRMSDEEWGYVADKLISRISGGRGTRRSPREIADALLIRLATGAAWGSIPSPISPNSLASHSTMWRSSGKFQLLVSRLAELRPGACYLHEARNGKLKKTESARPS